MTMASKWHRPSNGDAWIMGVLNCTPDSFSDGGQFNEVDGAIKHALSMWDAGAALIDVGGESTRPGSLSVPVDVELQRVVPVVQALTEAGCKVSIDTNKAEVMRQAIAAGADMVNDVTALTHDADSLSVVAEAGIDVCLMHMQGIPESMQNKPEYDNVVDDVMRYFEQRVETCVSAGVKESAIVLDPGIGFGKRLEDNLQLITHLEVFRQAFAMPILLGVSRKSCLQAITNTSANDCEIETVSANSIGVFSGADMVRVHDVALQRRAIQIASKLCQFKPA